MGGGGRRGGVGRSWGARGRAWGARVALLGAPGRRLGRSWTPQIDLGSILVSQGSIFVDLGSILGVQKRSTIIFLRVEQLSKFWMAKKRANQGHANHWPLAFWGPGSLGRGGDVNIPTSQTHHPHY